LRVAPPDAQGTKVAPVHREYMQDASPLCDGRDDPTDEADLQRSLTLGTGLTVGGRGGGSEVAGYRVVTSSQTPSFTPGTS